MNRNIIKVIGSTAVFSLIISAAVPVATVKASENEFSQLGGADVYETAAAVSGSNWTSSDNVILVSSDGYADSISAAVLSKRLNAPILLTGSSELSSVTSDEISRLNAKNIYIIGGEGVISNGIRSGLKSKGYNLIELSGKNRYDTNTAVAKKLVELGMDPSSVMMTGGEGFSDALSAAPVASAKDEILLLGGNNINSMASVVDFVKDNESKVTVIGTNNLINDSTYKTLGAVQRINGGKDRFETNLNILRAFSDVLKSERIYVANASGDRYADSLIAASIAGINSSPLVLISGEGESQTESALDYIKSKSASDTALNVISENGVISDSTISDIKNAAQGVVNDSNTVKSVATVGLNQVKVTFNTVVDENSAERAANYEIDGSSLGSEAKTQASAYRQDDGRSVVITFRNPFKQGEKVTFGVKNSVATEDSNDNIDKYEKDVVFQESGYPSLQSVTAVGGNKLQVRFSEPIRMKESDYSSMKINRKSILNYGLDKSYTEMKNQSGDWADGVDFYFNSPLPIGDNTFSISAGTSGSKFDNGANIPIQDQSKSFTIQSVSGRPQVQSVTSNNSGVLYVHFDRAMDKQTALEPSNYKINDTTVNVDSSYVTFDSGSGDKTVKIQKVASMFKQGVNSVTVDDDVEDTFGNSVSKTTSTLYYGNDTEKPTVSSANILNENTIRVKFSKDVLRSYATNKGNYRVTDSSGTDISYKIDEVNTVTVDGNNNRTFDIKFDEDTLRDSSYTLYVENVIDTQAKPNLMEPYSTVISGTDDEQVKVTQIVRRFDNSHAVAIFFNKTMDDASISNPSNYVFEDGTGEIRDIPGSAIVTPAYDDKSVTVEFSSKYTIGSGSTASSVIRVGVRDVVDKDGNRIQRGSYVGNIDMESSNGPKLIPDTARMTFVGSDINVKISLSESLDIMDLNDFRVDGYKPDAGNTNGNDVILIYKSGVDDNEKIDAIRECGESTNVSVVSTNSLDSAGRNIRTGSTKVYIPPMTKSDNFSVLDSSSGSDTIKIAFNQDIDDDIQNYYSDDFVFVNQSADKKITPSSVSIDEKYVVYKFAASSFDKGDTIKIFANDDAAKINIRSEKHNDSGYTTYSPIREDLVGYIITAK